jgi:hypothetical protein
LSSAAGECGWTQAKYAITNATSAIATPNPPNTTCIQVEADSANDLLSEFGTRQVWTTAERNGHTQSDRLSAALPYCCAAP